MPCCVYPGSRYTEKHYSYIAIELNVLYLKSYEIKSNPCAQAILPLIAFLGIH